MAEQNVEGTMTLLVGPCERGCEIHHTVVLKGWIGDHVFQSAMNAGVANIGAQRAGTTLFVAHHYREVAMTAQAFGQIAVSVLGAARAGRDDGERSAGLSVGREDAQRGLGAVGAGGGDGLLGRGSESKTER